MNPGAQNDAWLQRAVRIWDERADWWDDMSTANAQTNDRELELDRMQSALGIGERSRVLDAGCGSGQFAIAWAKRGCEVNGCDISAEMLARARRNAEVASVDVDFRQAPLAALPLPDRSCDAVFCRTVLHLVPAPVEALSEFRRVLRPSGRIYVSVPGALSPIYGGLWRRHLSHEARSVNDMVPWELESLLEETGWQITDQWGDWSGQDLEAPESHAAIGQSSGNLRLQQTTATTWGFVAR